MKDLLEAGDRVRERLVVGATGRPLDHRQRLAKLLFRFVQQVDAQRLLCREIPVLEGFARLVGERIMVGEDLGDLDQLVGAPTLELVRHPLMELRASRRQHAIV